MALNLITLFAYYKLIMTNIKKSTVHKGMLDPDNYKLVPKIKISIGSYYSLPASKLATEISPGFVRCVCVCGLCVCERHMHPLPL